jgi:hypothetical protein
VQHTAATDVSSTARRPVKTSSHAPQCAQLYTTGTIKSHMKEWHARQAVNMCVHACMSTAGVMTQACTASVLLLLLLLLLLCCARWHPVAELTSAYEPCAPLCAKASCIMQAAANNHTLDDVSLLPLLSCCTCWASCAHTVALHA